MSSPYLITTTPIPNNSQEKTASFFAKFLSAPYIARERFSITYLREKYHTDTIIVITQNGPVVHHANHKSFFHLNMAALRIANIRKKEPDHFLLAAGLSAGMTLLDCTLGMGTDAIVASFAVGAEGRVTGLESSPLLAAMTTYGLHSFVTEDIDISSAMHRIQVHHQDATEYLAQAKTNQYDVVYFDPMFRHPVHTSSGINTLRAFANKQPLSSETICDALRVAKCRVVLKERRNSTEFERLGFHNVVGGKHSSVNFGILETGAY